MAITDQLRSLAAREYGVLRSCITVLERKVVVPVAGERAGAVMERLSDTLDVYVRTLLHTPTAAEPTEAPEEQVVDQPTTVVTTTDDDEAVAEQDTSEEQVEELAEEYLEAEEGHLTGELAENEGLRRVQAELKAKLAIEESHEHGS